MNQPASLFSAAQGASSWDMCLYGSQDRRDRVVFEFHAFSAVVTLSLAFLLLGSPKLRRIYLPLSTVVNVTLLLQLLSDGLFFWGYPYSETRGNCAEIFTSRLYILLFMFGELHQVYFVANVLGMNRFRFQIPLVGAMALEEGLQLATVLVVASVVLSFFFFNKALFMVVHGFWTLFIVVVQIYFIRAARRRRVKDSAGGDMDEEDDARSRALVDANADAVSVFEALSWLQVIPTCVALCDRLLELRGVFVLASLDGVMLILECLAIYLFYIKILVLQEKAGTVSVEVV